MPPPGVGEFPPETRSCSTIDIVSSGADLLGCPDLPLACGLVAVVLERRQAPLCTLEDVEASPEERRAQRARRVDLLGERERRHRKARESRIAGEEAVGETSQQSV